MSSEYPKMLFPGGDASADPAIADEPGQEAALREEGYLTLREAAAGDTDQKPASTRRGKKAEG